MRVAAVVLLMLFVSGIAQAQERTFGDWYVVRSDNGDMVAATLENGTQYMLGYRCFKELGRCAHVLVADIDCTDGQMYPVLVNSDYSSLSMNALCENNTSTGKAELVLSEFDSIHKIMEKSNIVGFAIPMADGLFKVVRFSLRGANEAMQYASDTAGTAAIYK